MMKRILCASVAVISIICAAPAQAQDGPLRTSLVGPTGGITGSAVFTSTPEGVLVNVDVSGLATGWHAVHFHGTGDCSDHAAHFEKAGSHAAKEGQAHGYMSAEGPHSGDLPNMWIHGDGSGRAEFYTTETTFADLRDTDGAALMIHAGADDYASQPSGNSGARVACGVIGQ